MTDETGDVDVDAFLAQTEESWTIDGSEDRTHTFTGEQYRLDGNLYRIDLERDDFTQLESLRLSVTDLQDERSWWSSASTTPACS